VGESTWGGVTTCGQAPSRTRPSNTVLHDLIAHLAAQPDGGDAILRELLRADPDRAVRVVDGAKVARAWVRCNVGTARDPDDQERRPLTRAHGAWVGAAGLPHHGGGYWATALTEERGRHVDSRCDTPEAARAAVDAALIADGWVLAGVAP